MKNLRLLFIVIIVLISAVIGACNGQDDTTDGADDKGQIVIGRNNWAENIAVSHMWEILLEEQGYDVEIRAMDKAPVWLGVSRGELDIAPEVWLPNTDHSYMERYGDNVEMHDIWYEKTGLGLVVPSYMDIDSIDELNEIKEDLKGRIVGIDPGASLTEMTKNAVNEYGLDLDLITSSDPAMMAELSTHYNREDPIVVTLWSPHWAFSEYDLKYLEDPKNVYGEPDDIYYMTRTGFTEDYPEVVQWMNNWFMDDASLGNLMAVIKDTGDGEEGARLWLEENRELVNAWIQ
ncbi:glycine betaine ABC transporter substrate-binding protein [Bacillus sp. FJAT-45350]|uniref:glycine betaine ABC transporter substrate-binding protein n=1 Tax=Bacillus sp. FJAT-45350 TaxID=2011014 RepID=UPI000BB6E369|nr:glycine betaine ABC transporter substrate-binding protein [Bacillus sp. FJAT-45350]